MIPDHHEARGLYAAILARPHDDLSRLIFADWLEEHQGSVRCESCKGSGMHWPVGRVGGAEPPWHECHVCRGTGTISHGCAERAEFIRVQCELAGMKCKIMANGQLMSCETKSGLLCGVCDRGRDLRQHEMQLLGFAAGGRTPSDKLNWDKWSGTAAETVERRDVQGQVLRMFSRGFVSIVRDPLAMLIGGECERCGGFGRINDQRASRYEDLSQRCTTCFGTGRIPGIAPRIAAEHPVTRWEASDKEPQDMLVGFRMETRYVWWPTDPIRSPYRAQLRAQLPIDLFRRLGGGGNALDFKHYPAPELALDALSAAIAEWVKLNPSTATPARSAAG